MHYVLRVQGHLDPSWQDRFGGWRIEQQEAGTTLLSGTLPDQAALHGLLLQIVRLGLTCSRLRQVSLQEVVKKLQNAREVKGRRRWSSG